MNSPYAGFDASPEARAVQGAADLGTLVVAPAGGEGSGGRPRGHDRLARHRARRAGGGRVRRAPGGRPHRPRDRRRRRARRRPARRRSRRPGRMTTAGPVDATDPSKLLADGSRSLRGRLAIVRAGDEPVTRAAAAAAAGARAVLLAEPRDRPLPAIPAGRIAAPVLGVTGPAAEAVLGEDPGRDRRGRRRGGRQPAGRPAVGGVRDRDGDVAVLEPRPVRRGRRQAGRRRARRRADRDPRRSCGRRRRHRRRRRARRGRGRPARARAAERIAARAARRADRRGRPRPAARRPRRRRRRASAPAAGRGDHARAPHPPRAPTRVPGTAACVRVVLENQGASEVVARAVRDARPAGRRPRSPAGA